MPCDSANLPIRSIISLEPIQPREAAAAFEVFEGESIFRLVELLALERRLIPNRRSYASCNNQTTVQLP